MVGKFAFLLAASALIATEAAFAVEPGVPNNYSPGATMGDPVAAAPPPGAYLSTSFLITSASEVDGDGNTTGMDATVHSVASTLTWATGWSLLGGSHLVVVNQPFVHLDIRGPATKMNVSGFANTYIAPVVLSWMLKPEWFVSAGAGVYLPNGADRIRSHFWGYGPQMAMSYLNDGWDLTLHALYDVNATSEKSDYRTGDRLYLDITATKTWNDWELGAVGYLVDQTTGDANYGMTYGPMKPTFGREQRLSLGGLVGRNFGNISVKFIGTAEAFAYHAPSGCHFWLKVGFPLALGSI